MCVHTHQNRAFTSPTSPHFDAPGSLKPWSSGTKLRCVWRTLATSWKTTQNIISTLTSPTAPTRSTSSAPCRSCREWGLCTPSPAHASPARPTSSQSQSDSVPLLQEQQRDLPGSSEGDRETACVWGPAHDLFPDSPHAEGDPAAAADRCEYPMGRLGCCRCHGNPPGGPAFNVVSRTSFLTLTDL